jgi:Polysaccharide biosynthesis protein
MTIPEAAWLILDAAAMGESGDLFVLDIGEPVRIIDLARDLVRLAGRDPGPRVMRTGPLQEVDLEKDALLLLLQADCVSFACSSPQWSGLSSP